MLAVLWFAPVQAQSAEPAADSVDTVAGLEVSAEPPAVDASVTASIVAEEPELEGMVVEQPKEVPSVFGLWWKGVKEKVSIGLTFNPIKKAEKQLQFAEERMKLAELMAQKSKDQKVQARIHRAIGQAQEMMEKVEARRERLLQQKDEQAARLLRNIATHQIRREAVMDKIEEKLPEGAIEKFDELRDKGMMQERRLLNAINNENAPAEVREHLQAVKDRIEAHAEEIKLFRERRAELMDEFKAGDEAVKEQTKEEMKELRQDRVEMLKDRREERVEKNQNGEAIKPPLENKPGAIIKLKALKQELKNEFKEEKNKVKKEIDEPDDDVNDDVTDNKNNTVSSQL